MLVDLRDFGLIWQRKVNFHSVSRGVFVSDLMCDFHWFFFIALAYVSPILPYSFGNDLDILPPTASDLQWDRLGFTVSGIHHP